MKPASFDYARPNSVPEALRLLSEHSSGAKVIAGGQSLVPMMNFRMARPEFLVDINRLSDLDFHFVESGELVIGALARHATLFASNIVRDACPLMAEAYKHVAHGPTRGPSLVGRRTRRLSLTPGRPPRLMSIRKLMSTPAKSTAATWCVPWWCAPLRMPPRAQCEPSRLSGRAMHDGTS
jgi:xanthine dehydrogenase iron-sulfur cluster and FAD-binding subunit A